MATGLFIAAAIIGAIVFAIVVLIQRGREGVELSPRNLVRLYLYFASLAGVIVLVIGLSALTNFGMAATFGNDVVYGQPPSMQVFIKECPPGAVGCPGPDDQRRQQEEQQRRQLLERERRKGEDLLRGITFTLFGAVFWGAHWTARRRIVGPDEGGSGLWRGYLMIGTAIFGLATIVLLPSGLYQVLSNALLPGGPEVFRPGVADTLGGGIVSLPVWLLYLRLVAHDFRQVRQATAPTVPTASD